MTLKPRTLVAALAAAGLSLSALPALADRPLTTDNADVHERGACVAEAGADRATERNTPSVTGTEAKLVCGIGWSHEVGLGLARARSQGVTAKATSLGGKWGLVEAKDGKPGFSIGWGLDWQSVGGGPTEREGSFVTGILSMKPADGLNVHANLGWSHSKSARQSSATWGLAAEKAVGGPLELLGEVFGAEHDGSPWALLGLRWAAVPEKFFLDLGHAFKTGGNRPRVTTVGLRIEF